MNFESKNMHFVARCYIFVVVNIHMKRLEELRRRLKPGRVYRRADLAQWSKAVDRHMVELVKTGTLQKIAPGIYYHPREAAFGTVPPDDHILIERFLKDDQYLLMSPNAYNSLGLGLTQLYNTQAVYNHKRHGKFKLGNKVFDFRRVPHFPLKITTEFLLIDLVNNLDSLAEDKQEVLAKLAESVRSVDVGNLMRSVKRYGTVRTKKFFSSFSQHPALQTNDLPA